MASSASSSQKDVVYKYTVNDGEVEFNLVSYLKKGGFARPELCRAHRLVVLKKVPIDNPDHPDVDKRVLEREGKILMGILHRNIVRIYHMWFDNLKNEFVMELEYCAGGSLKDAVRNQRGLFDREKVRNWLAQISIGLDYIHKCGIVHRDLKTDNVLLSGDKKIAKIADFGTAKFYNVSTSFTFQSIIGTPTYMAPESFGNDPGAPRDDPKVDVWALGVVAYELATLDLPYRPTRPNITPMEVLFDFGSKYQRKERPVPIDGGHFSPALQDLISEKLLVIEQKSRATMDEVLRHEFIAKSAKAIQKENDEGVFPERKEQSLHGGLEVSLVPVSEYRECKTQLAETKATVGQLTAELATVRKKLAESQTTAKNATEEVKRLKRQLADSQASASQQLEVEKRRLNDELENVRKQAAARIGEMEERNKQLQSELEQNQPKIAALEQKLKESDNAINKVKPQATSSVVRQSLVQPAQTPKAQRRAMPELFEAAKTGNLAEVKRLLRAGADPNAKDKDNYGCTALHYAAICDHKDVAALLIDKGADVSSKDNSGLTALHCAAGYGHKDVADLLKKHGAK